MARDYSIEIGVVDILNSSLYSTLGKNDLQSAPVLLRSHCVCHFLSPSFFNSVANVVVGILLYTIFSSYSAVSLAVCLPAHFPRFQNVLSAIRSGSTSSGP